MILTLATVCLAGFLAATVDAIAGGGGLISLPALLLAGIPPQLALGTNKFASTTASFNSSFTFARSGKVYFPLVKRQVLFTFLGACLGVWSVLHIGTDFLNKIVFFLILLVGIYTVVRKDLGMEDHFQGLKPSGTALGIVFAFVLGFYDGFFGPGTGSFLIFAFIALYGFDFVSASANAKVLNFTSNLASLLLFAWMGKIVYLYALPMALAMITGSRLGTRLAVGRGVSLVKPVFLTMSLLVAVKLVWQVLR
ncbi:Transmembrane protein TauE-like [Acididesulfobacillus acetoxydans]|uniref:Probable membrane transporter protein n=1 Tax=Acididesulfobacillus acetoxydans TaxID=1561005 RepID=A0A8S0XWJ1_9FIRM|nr:TSUP family transporter [Acididesulfobacillus acetoxydans]CAA7601067.1 Transmembrane protein TauE-like [Acididesulfobacillus acetoxydans]CEJ06941.1 UPF0721 transmembrane protein HI 0198 [Acididesulfobacillus acetoxydans]